MVDFRKPRNRLEGRIEGQEERLVGTGEATAKVRTSSKGRNNHLAPEKSFAEALMKALQSKNRARQKQKIPTMGGREDQYGGDDRWVAYAELSGETI